VYPIRCTDFPGGIGGSRGALEPSKGSWGFVDFIWVSRQWKYVSKEGYPAKIEIPDSNGNLIKI
jgi:hypothetical protein